MKTPSDFKVFPWSSVSKNSETETIAQNIMIILSRTGNEFRELSWDEYKEERLKDGGFSDRERAYFDKSIGFCKSEDTAVLFSPKWSSVKNNP